MLVQPLCGDPETEAALAALLGVQQPLGVVGAGCRSALGASAPGAVPRALPRCTNLAAGKMQSRTAPSNKSDSETASAATCDLLPRALQWRYDSADIARAHRTSTPKAGSQLSSATPGRSASEAPAVARLKQPTAADTGVEKWWSRASQALWDDAVSTHTQRATGRNKRAASRPLTKQDVAKLLKQAAFVAMVRRACALSLAQLAQFCTRPGQARLSRDHRAYHSTHCACALVSTHSTGYMMLV